MSDIPVKQVKLIYRRDQMIGYSFFERQWATAGKLKMIPRHRQFRDDPRIVYIIAHAPWNIIRDYLWEIIGASSPEDLQKSIEEVYARQVRDEERFFLHVGKFTV